MVNGRHLVLARTTVIASDTSSTMKLEEARSLSSWRFGAEAFRLFLLGSTVDTGCVCVCVCVRLTPYVGDGGPGKIQREGKTRK